MCHNILGYFILSKNKVKPSAIQVSNDGAMEWSECDVHIISSNDPVGCIRFLPNKKKIVNNLNTRGLIWNCSSQQATVNTQRCTAT